MVSIDARIKTVQFHADGRTVFVLEDRPARPGQVAGCRGQESLVADRRNLANGAAGLLCGCEVWGGSESLVLGDVVIARRKTYRELEWTDPANLLSVVLAYRKAKGLDNDAG